MKNTVDVSFVTFKLCIFYYISNGYFHAIYKLHLDADFHRPSPTFPCWAIFSCLPNGERVTGVIPS